MMSVTVRPAGVQFGTDCPATRLRVVPMLLVESFEEGEASSAPRDLSGGLGDRPTPNFARSGDRDYGMRVGIVRLASMLRDLGLPITVAIDSASLDRYPRLVDRLLDLHAEFVMHGVAITNPIGEHLSEDKEAAYVRSVVESFASRGIETASWLSPEYSQSSRTPFILSRAGVRVMCDWGNADRVCRVAGTELINLPILADYDDSYALVTRGRPDVDFYADLANAAAALGGEDIPHRTMSIAIRPWITGHAHRVPLARSAFTAMLDRLGATAFAKPSTLLRELDGCCLAIGSKPRGGHDDSP